MGTGDIAEHKNNMSNLNNLVIKGYTKNNELIGSLDYDNSIDHFQPGYVWYTEKTAHMSAYDTFRDVSFNLFLTYGKDQEDFEVTTVKIFDMAGTELVTWTNPIKVDLFYDNGKPITYHVFDWVDFDIASEVSDNMCEDIFRAYKSEYPEIAKATFTYQNDDVYTVSQ